MQLDREKLPGWELVREAMEAVYAEYLQRDDGRAGVGLLKDQAIPRIYEAGLWPSDEVKEEVLAEFVRVASTLCLYRKLWYPWMAEFLLVQAADSVPESYGWLKQALKGSAWYIRKCNCTVPICPGFVVATQEWFDNPQIPRE